MGMVKAFGYGLGDVAVSKCLEENRTVDYLGVAYCSEGVHLRNAGIKLPIMVMNPSTNDFSSLMAYNIEPTICTMSQLMAYADFIKSSGIEGPAVHIKVDTGMHRLGFSPEEWEKVSGVLKDSPITVKGIYTHFAATPEEEHDRFSLEQASRLEQFYTHLSDKLQETPMLHAMNSAGILRFQEFQFDMVRLGMGLYGYDPSHIIQDKLRCACCWITEISQINTLKKGETVGYSRVGEVMKDHTRIAVLAVGYADGYRRAFSNGKAEVWINGQRAATIGNVCMDMTFVDVTEIPCSVGDQVELLGPHITAGELAEAAGTIDYEILTGIGPRVERRITKHGIASD